MSEEIMNEDGIEVIDPLEDSAATGSPELPEKKPVSTFRLVATLAIAGTLAGLLIVLVNQHTKPLIDKYKAEQLQIAVYEVLPGVDHYSTFYLVDEALSANLPEGVKESDYKRIYVGYDTSHKVTGVAISRGESGFQDVVQVIFGLDPASGKLTGMKVLDSKETPGLGDKIFKDLNFVQQFFEGPQTPLIPVKIGAGKGLPGEVDTITGATISSKAVIQIINNGLAEWKPYIDRGIPQEPAGVAEQQVQQ